MNWLQDLFFKSGFLAQHHHGVEAALHMRVHRAAPVSLGGVEGPKLAPAARPGAVATILILSLAL